MATNSNNSPFGALFAAKTQVVHDAQIVFKLPAEQKAAFAKMCEQHKTDVSTVLRAFIEAQVTPPAREPGNG